MFDKSQYLQQFVDEAQEYLENLNHVLLQWERHPEDKDMVQEVFRIAHTLKGMAATMELEDITILSHHLENLLDQVRQDKVKAEGSFFDLLLASVDALSGLVQHVAEGSTPDRGEIASLLARLEGFGSGQAQPSRTEEERVDAITFNEYESRVIARAQKEGFGVFQIRIWLQAECLLKRARVYVILRSLEQLGEIIKTVPSVEDLEEEKFSDDFVVVLVCRSGEEGIRKIMAGLAEIERYELTALNLPPDPKAPALAPAGEESPGPAKKTTENERMSARQTVRVGIERLDQLMNLVGELVITKTRLEQLLAFHSGSEVEEALKGLGRISATLQDVVMQARMVPVAQVFNRFPRMIRDMAKEMGKEIKLVISGEETELDRRVIDELADPLVHIIRNAVDHGLEDPAARVAAGKPPQGRLDLLAYYEGNSVVIEVKDDGRGISLEKLREKAIAEGFISPAEAETMGEEETLNLIFTFGFSTAARVSSVSGRGVGLDAVRTKIESLNGSIDLETELGVGTVFRIKIPLTLAIIQALLITLGSEVYALPLERVEEIRRAEEVVVKSIQGKEVINIRGEVLPLVHLREILQVPEEAQGRGEYFLVVHAGQQRLALLVDGLVGQKEIVIKPLARLLTRIPLWAGATILGDGKVALILDTDYLLAGSNVGREVS